METVLCNGKLIVENYRCTSMDENEVMDSAQVAAEEICSAGSEDWLAADSVLAKAVKKGLI